MPLKGLANSSLVEAQGFRKVSDPYGGGEVVVIPAIAPDWAVLHVHECDPGGNAFIDGSRYDDVLLALAAGKVLVTCEKIVGNDRFVESPRRTDFPGFMVDAVVEVPGGARPTSCARLYPYDREFLTAYLQAAADDARYGEFLAARVYGAQKGVSL